MNLDVAQRRDRRIAELEDIPHASRTREQRTELFQLQMARDLLWARLPAALARARAKAAQIEAYARQFRLSLEETRQ